MCLFEAVSILSKKEKGKYPVYSGLHGVKMSKTFTKTGYFVTYKGRVSEHMQSMVYNFPSFQTDCSSNS